IPSIPSSSSVGRYCSETSSCDTTRWHSENKCDHELRAVVKYSWTFLNPNRWLMLGGKANYVDGSEVGWCFYILVANGT
ncbi:hypothetical protein SETIT_3G295300v2, partial [Setaria italica]